MAKSVLYGKNYSITCWLDMVYPGFHGPNTGYEDDWTDVPAAGFWPKWFGGAIVPVAFIAYGIMCLVAQHGYLPGDARYGGIGIQLQGSNAIALGVASLGAGTFFHCHYFWGNIYHYSGWATIGKIAGAIAFIFSFGYLIVRIGVYGAS